VDHRHCNQQHEERHPEPALTPALEDIRRRIIDLGQIGGTGRGGGAGFCHGASGVGVEFGAGGTTESAIHARYSALPASGAERISGSSYEWRARMARVTASCSARVVLAWQYHSSASSTAPCQR